MVDWAGMSPGVLQAAGGISVFSGCRAGELQDLGTWQRCSGNLRQGLWVSPRAAAATQAEHLQGSVYLHPSNGSRGCLGAWRHCRWVAALACTVLGRAAWFSFGPLGPPLSCRLSPILLCPSWSHRGASSTLSGLCLTLSPASPVSPRSSFSLPLFHPLGSSSFLYFPPAPELAFHSSFPVPSQSPLCLLLGLLLSPWPSPPTIPPHLYHIIVLNTSASGLKCACSVSGSLYLKSHFVNVSSETPFPRGCWIVSSCIELPGMSWLSIDNTLGNLHSLRRTGFVTEIIFKIVAFC